jgi:hypothetical protein
VLDNESVTTDIDWEYSIETSVYDYLKADYNILQGIQSVTQELAIKPMIKWVKGHQDRDTPWDKLTILVKVNCHADQICSETHNNPVWSVGLFPKWIPGTKAGLLHHGKLITKWQDKYIVTAATAPSLQAYLIKKSDQHDPSILTEWSNTTFNDIDWSLVESSFKALSIGR